jgi:hypothetical protein
MIYSNCTATRTKNPALGKILAADLATPSVSPCQFNIQKRVALLPVETENFYHISDFLESP